MIPLVHGDRIRWETTDDDGLPMVRYGFVGGVSQNGTAVVMLDGDLKGNTVVRVSEIERVSITNVELRLTGSDLLDDPSLRQGLVQMWSAEADQAGLEVNAVQRLGTGVRDTASEYALAELQSGGRHYVLRAIREQIDVVCVRADLPRRWE